MYDDPRLQELKDYLINTRKLSVMTVKDILWKVKELFL